MLKKIGIAIVAVVAAVLIYAATRPDTFTVQRSATINAPGDTIYGYINDFHQWTAWSPYEKLDPDMKRTYSGAESGKGAVYAWEGSGAVGAGRMEITEAVPAERVNINLDFLKPFAISNTADFTLTPEGGATKVTWAMHGPVPYVSKVMQMFFDMDTMVGKDFEIGLSNLKTVAEKAAADSPPTAAPAEANPTAASPAPENTPAPPSSNQ